MNRLVGSRPPPFLGLSEHAEILPGYPAPDRVSSEQVGTLSHGVAAHRVGQETENIGGKRLPVIERRDHAPLLCQHLGGVPVGSGDDRLATAHGVGQRA